MLGSSLRQQLMLVLCECECECECECVFIYRTYRIVSQGGLQLYLSEIGRQLVKAPRAAAISPLSLLS